MMIDYNGAQSTIAKTKIAPGQLEGVLYKQTTGSKQSFMLLYRSLSISTDLYQ
jgi:hypothetical protein